MGMGLRIVDLLPALPEPKLVPKVFGQLHPNDAEHLTKYLQNASKIRVKVVDTVPKHLSADNTDVAYISVWVKS